MIGVEAAIGTESVRGKPRPGNEMRSTLIVWGDMMLDLIVSSRVKMYGGRDR